MAYFAIFKGISVANFHLLSVEQIGEENDKLTQEIAQTEILMNNDYQHFSYACCLFIYLVLRNVYFNQWCW